MSAWMAEPSVSLPVLATAALYLRGWSLARRRLPQRLDVRHAVVFLSGLALMMLALAPRLEALTQRSFAAHMVQHLLLVVVVAPMVWLGAPEVPLFVGLPRRGRGIVLTLTKGEVGRRLTRWLLHPSVGWIAFALGFWVWHAPVFYNLALESHFWHHVEHACFLVSALLFWRPVLLAWPARISWPRWTMIPYLGLAMFQSLPLATILTFSDRVIYEGCASIDDQALGGVIMWVPGSLPLLLAIIRLIVELSSRPVALASRHA